MTLFSIAKKNIKGNFKNYFIYFVSMIFSMVIYYTFVSLQYNDAIKNLIDNLNSLKSIFMMSSLILILFAIVFISYSNSFFIRKRKKEIGLYSMVGIPKKTIGKMMFFENLILGMISLAIGIILGLLFSRFFSMILISLLDGNVSIDFSFSLLPILNATLIFSVIILLTSIKSYRLIYKFKLIDLFKIESENSKIPRASLLSYFYAITSAILLIFAFIMSNRSLPDNSSEIIIHMLSIVVSIILGTYLLFSNLVPYILKLLRNNKKSYYRDINMIGTSHLLYRIKGNINTLTITALLSALTISLFASVFSEYNGSIKLSKDFAPFSYTHLSKGYEYDNRIKSIIESDKDHKLLFSFDIPVIEVNSNFDGPRNYSTTLVRIVPESVFNDISKTFYNSTNIKLKNNETMAIRPLFTNHKSDEYKNSNISLDINNKNYMLQFKGIVEGRILTWDNPDFYIVVNDSTFNDMKGNITPLIFKAYEVSNEKDTKNTAEKLKALNPPGNNIFASEKDNTQIFTFHEVYKRNIDQSSLLLFVVSFLGLVFLSATGSIIYFKQLTDATENKYNYSILSKLGITKKEIYLSIAKQNLFIFVLPLLVAALDSMILLNFLSRFMSNLIGANLILPVAISMTAFTLLYIIYYLLTVNTYNRVVN